MCGRVIQYKDPSTYGSALRATGSPNSPPHYNGAPGQDLLVVRSNPETGHPEIGVLRWGLIPNWAKDRKIAWRLINARCETIERTAAFRKAYASRRCLIPVDGFYEWRKIGKAKQPYMIAMKDGMPFTLAGLWENWKDPDSGEWIRTFTIVTTEANELVAKLHDRMPVVIAAADRARWIAGEDVRELMRPYPAQEMTFWPVSMRVNSSKNEDPSLINAIELEQDPATGNDDLPTANMAARAPSNSE